MHSIEQSRTVGGGLQYTNGSTRGFIDYNINQDLKPRHRHILAVWLLEVCESYNLCSVTHQKAMNLIDRYLSSQVISKGQLQCLGVTALLMASKKYSGNPLSSSDASFVGDGTCPSGLIFQLEEEFHSALTESEMWDKECVFQVLTTCYGDMYKTDAYVACICDFLSDLCTCDPRLHEYASTELADAIMGIALTLRKFRNQPDTRRDACKHSFIEGSTAWHIEQAVAANDDSHPGTPEYPKYRANNKYVCTKHETAIGMLLESKCRGPTPPDCSGGGHVPSTV